jgi:carbamoyltransferase
VNSVANGKIARSTPFRRVYVPPAPGDAGGAIGAAFAVWHALRGPRSFVMDHACWGPEFADADTAATLAAAQDRFMNTECRIEKLAVPELCRRVAAAIADGSVVGWFQGRMEWGPRALGNRSILCDPRRADIKAVLNAKIKKRESFRPFAPSILEEAVDEWFEENGEVPFMMQVFQVREQKRALIPAVTHVDGSARLQTVSRHANPRYHRLIEEFCGQTGVPMLLNTSFNENEPIVRHPQEALDCFLRSEMDVLVIGDMMVSRPQGTAV